MSDETTTPAPRTRRSRNSKPDGLTVEQEVAWYNERTGKINAARDKHIDKARADASKKCSAILSQLTSDAQAKLESVG